MDIWSKDFEMGEASIDGVRYTLTKVEGKYLTYEDESGQEKEADITHRINGFEVPLYVVIMEHDNTFSFAYETAPGLGMFQGLADEKIFNQAAEILCDIVESE